MRALFMASLRSLVVKKKSKNMWQLPLATWKASHMAGSPLIKAATVQKE